MRTPDISVLCAVKIYASGRTRSQASLISARITFNNPENGVFVSALKGMKDAEMLAKDKSHYVSARYREILHEILQEHIYERVICTYPEILSGFPFDNYLSILNL